LGHLKGFQLRLVEEFLKRRVLYNFSIYPTALRMYKTFLGAAKYYCKVGSETHKALDQEGDG
jgi:hypothetical protein